MFGLSRRKSHDLSAEIKPLIYKLGSSPGAGEKASLITFISARSGEGTSTVARAFAKAVNAETGKKILLIIGSTNRTGTNAGIVELAISAANISSVLTGIGSGVFSGCWVGSPQGQAQSGRVIQDQDFWLTLKKDFDVIIIDAPSLQASSDGIAFAQISDMTILVVEAESTRKQVIENLRDTLTTAKASIVGIVMNKRKFYIPARVYKRL
jgi:Mrp family chromosome partitioning ATPase